MSRRAYVAFYGYMVALWGLVVFFENRGRFRHGS